VLLVFAFVVVFAANPKIKFKADGIVIDGLKV
jgi:hypothetical protein